MWMIRVLTGPLAGKTFQLKKGTNVLGRAGSCDVVLNDKGISKEHAKIDVLEGKIIVSDLNSRNGTFVNGIKIKSQRVSETDKIGFFNMICDLKNDEKVHSLNQPLQNHQIYRENLPQVESHPQVANPIYLQQSALDLNASTPDINYSSSQPEDANSVSAIKGNQLADFPKLAQNYIENVALPGVYRLAEVMEFRWVLMLFMLAFILFVTSLSSLPLMRILKASIEQESQRRAMTIARNLAQFNAGAIREGQLTGTSVNIATREVGVDTALIISSSDGSVIAPANRAAKYPDLPFVHEARRLGQEVVEQIDGSTIGAIVPIDAFNPETGARGVIAYAVVIYNMGTLAVDDKQTISLFIQTFFIAVIVGAFLFFLLFKLIEFPIRSLNTQLGTALRDKSDNLSIDYQFPALQELTSNINSLLNRTFFGADDGAQAVIQEKDRSMELQNTVDVIGYPALGIDADTLTIRHANLAFEERTAQNLSHLLHMSLTNITDQALQLSLKDLADQVIQSPDQISTNDLEIGGENHQILAYGVWGGAKLAYLLMVIVPKAGED